MEWASSCVFDLFTTGYVPWSKNNAWRKMQRENLYSIHAKEMSETRPGTLFARFIFCWCRDLVNRNLVHVWSERCDYWGRLFSQNDRALNVGSCDVVCFSNITHQMLENRQAKVRPSSPFCDAPETPYRGAKKIIDCGNPLDLEVWDFAQNPHYVWPSQRHSQPLIKFLYRRKRKNLPSALCTLLYRIK